MTADVELLPSSVATFVEALKGERGALDAWLEVNNEQEVAAHVEAYAHAAAAQAAEIEALRAEVAEWKRVASAQAELHGEAEARAERLAEASRETRRVGWPAIIAAAIAISAIALAQSTEGAQEDK